VRHNGFRPITRSGITPVVDQTARVDFIMEVGAVTERVEATGNASVVETQSSTIKGAVDEHRIRELPLNGRDAAQLILLMPGIYGTTDASGLQQGDSGRGIIQPEHLLERQPRQLGMHLTQVTTICCGEAFSLCSLK
jgi:hypothetical protein